MAYRFHVLTLVMLMLLLVETSSFLAPRISDNSGGGGPMSHRKQLRDMHQLSAMSPIQDSSENSSRREFVVNCRNNFLFLSSVSVIRKSPAAAISESSYSADRPVAILGGGGRTGKEVAIALARQGMHGVAMTRTGKSPRLSEYTKDFVQIYPEPVNVCDAEGLLKAMQSVGASAIVYCASASAQGGNAFQVDDVGVANAAAAAKTLDARFVLVSALGVDRPDSKGYKMTNSIGGNYDKIMDAKRQGEEKTRSILAKDKNYVIVRPGPLMGVKTMNGAADIELNQGDFIGGGISRDELAGVVVGALLSEKKGATVEVYRTKTRQKIQPEFDMFSGNEFT
eukprot:CAMPEP_0172544508 /NCGR_PEP_ID=MMETSP1067-20121228/14651_1 /TAXON_ID=265564 ORGANISM="Thalassiosira punctigera, Strain Tpunct2005C2" /NCGR_SAMPLE_ID=MMETSP1067 /ASSEMBLY_ACC=CAM_ASM_000444 /LENGTH=338 /DNA_ID=CAMNT_0013331083 /DNA_START=171 /DNA_END=1183 /DNA_ORIENTATION=+